MGLNFFSISSTTLTLNFNYSLSTHPNLSSAASYRQSKMTFEVRWLLNTCQFTIEMNIWDYKLLTFKDRLLCNTGSLLTQFYLYMILKRINIMCLIYVQTCKHRRNRLLLLHGWQQLHTDCKQEWEISSLCSNILLYDFAQDCFSIFEFQIFNRYAPFTEIVTPLSNHAADTL